MRITEALFNTLEQSCSALAFLYYALRQVSFQSRIAARHLFKATIVYLPQKQFLIFCACKELTIPRAPGNLGRRNSQQCLTILFGRHLLTNKLLTLKLSFSKRLV